MLRSAQQHKGETRLHSSRVSGFFVARPSRGPHDEVGGKGALPEEVEAEAREHADAGGAEAVVPAEPLAERAADERGEERAEVDPHVEDREGAVPPRIARRVEASDLCRDVGLEGAVAEIRKRSAGKKSDSTAMRKWPIAIRTAPRITARCWPITLSASIPPKKGVR